MSGAAIEVRRQVALEAVEGVLQAGDPVVVAAPGPARRRDRSTDDSREVARDEVVARVELLEQRLDPISYIRNFIEKSPTVNPSGHGDPAWEAALDEALGADPTQLGEAAAELNRVVTEDAIAVFLTSPPYAIAHDDNVVGIEVTTSAYLTSAAWASPGDHRDNTKSEQKEKR